MQSRIYKAANKNMILQSKEKLSYSLILAKDKTNNREKN